MEKKTIGQFIATLRKANGMTQKQLAERLNVSDKAVSRWERDESAPDLTLIPVIAEIFQVTSDELLRGEKKNVETVADSPRTAEKTEKQIENLLNGTKMKLSTQGLISIAVASVGVIIAMLCNFAFYRAYLGFYIGGAFCLVALVCEIIFAMKAFYSVENSEFTGESIVAYKMKFVASIKKVIITIIAELVFMSPLIIFPWNGYWALNAITWYSYGGLFAAVAVVICIFVSWLVNINLIKKWNMPENGIKETIAVNRLRIKYSLITAVFLFVTLVLQINVNCAVSPEELSKGTTFDDIDKFIEYMETPLREYEEDGDDYVIEEILSYGTYYNQETIYDRKGEKIIADFIWRNETVWTIEWEWDDDGNFESVTAYTGADYKTADNIQIAINVALVALYFVEIIVMVANYRKKCKKM